MTPPSDMPSFWRTLDERAGEPQFDRFVANEFPTLLPDRHASGAIERRTFLKLSGASLALAAAAGCTRQPLEKIVPYVRQPEDLVPGRPLYFATAMSLGGTATGLLVESHEGRPTKVEGNPLHPASLGASDVFAQASILGLYDPDRSTALTRLGEIQPWSAFRGAIRALLAIQQLKQGAGIRLLTESVCSPTLASQIRDLIGRYPRATWHQWDPASRENARGGAKLAFGRYVDARYRLDRADVIVSLDADLLGGSPGGLRYARDFAARRRPEHADRMSRLYAVETMPTGTGARADHRLALKPSDIERFAFDLAARVGARGVPISAANSTSRFAAMIADDLRAHQGTSLIVAGDHQPTIVHALAHAMNEALRNAGVTVEYTEPVEAQPTDQLSSLRDLVADMRGGSVEALIILGGNPVYTAPSDLRFADAMSNIPLRVHHSLYDDETSALCHWQVPEAHFLEAWSDARAFDGTVSIVQPLIAPLYGGKSSHEFLAAFGDRPERSGYDIVRESWKVNPEDDGAWRTWLHDGVIPGTMLEPTTVRVRGDFTADAAVPGGGTTPEGQGLEVGFRLDPTVLDGRFANNGWLQELSKPITKLTWDNAILVSPATAAQLSARAMPAYEGGEHGEITGDVLELRVGGRSVQGAVFPVIGHADGCVTIHLGYGRSRGGLIANGAGFDANQVRVSTALWRSTGAELSRTGRTFPLACTQYHHLMEGRGLVRATTREAYLKDPASVREGDETPPRTITLYPEYQYPGYKWGMAIDVNACIGCNACVIGCQAENNIPVVGKDQVLKGREMHWIRIDTYYRGEMVNPETYFQPVPCMQCENAPCEAVCPVGATVHSDEGLNDMVYNRCVGTRYCSNNCPYKVRRFNFLLYQDWNTQSLKLGRNPDVTVRSRGVMEKCTYCVQRINAAKIRTEEAGRRIRDGDIVPACQQACPSDAIVFGDLNDPNSRVAGLQAEARCYSLLGELNTRPRTRYLAAVRNENTDLGA